MVVRLTFALLVVVGSSKLVQAQELAGSKSGFVENQGVKLHYVAIGEGPLVIMLHGFPDYWYTWRAQMPTLAKTHQVVAFDLRGYNLSDKPEGVENYAMERLLGDVSAVADHFHSDKFTLVGHDWGGAIAWTYAMSNPKRVERLVILNLPHPRGLMRELANNPAQQKASQYAAEFQKEGADAKLTPEMLTFWVKDAEARKHYLEAFRRSSLPAMLAYYKANYPRPPFDKIEASEMPNVKCPTLLIHGLDDTALLPGALNDTWKWVDNELTLVTIPGAGHFVQQDAVDRVTRVVDDWLAR